MVDHCIFMDLVRIACILLLIFIFQPFSTFIFRLSEGGKEMCLRDSTSSKTPFTLDHEQHGYSIIESSFRNELLTNGTCCTSFCSVPQRFRCDKKRKKNTEVTSNNAMCWEGEAFATKSVLRYAHASPMGFYQMYPKAQICFRK